MSRWQSYWLQYVFLSAFAAGGWVFVFGWLSATVRSGAWLGWLLTVGGGSIIATYTLFWSIQKMITERIEDSHGAV